MRQSFPNSRWPGLKNLPPVAGVQSPVLKPFLKLMEKTKKKEEEKLMEMKHGFSDVKIKLRILVGSENKMAVG